MAIASRHHASRVRLFGSAARGDDRPDSDIDLLVDFDEDSSLFRSEGLRKVRLHRGGDQDRHRAALPARLHH